jgi:hypothetical protein
LVFFHISLTFIKWGILLVFWKKQGTFCWRIQRRGWFHHGFWLLVVVILQKFQDLNPMFAIEIGFQSPQLEFSLHIFDFKTIFIYFFIKTNALIKKLLMSVFLDDWLDVFNINNAFWICIFFLDNLWLTNFFLMFYLKRAPSYNKQA